MVSSWVQVSDLVAVLAFVLFIALSFMKGLSDHPHYFNAIWPALFYLIWRGACYAWNYRSEGMAPWAGRAVVLLWVTASGLCMTGASLRAHLGNGTRSLHYGPTIGNLWSLSEELLKMPGAEIIPVAYHIRMFPHGLQTLVSLRMMSEKTPEPSLNPGRWLITYRDSKQTWNGLIVMERMDDKGNGLLPVPKENAKSAVK